MTKIQTEQSDGEEFGSDGRRAKLADLRALEAKLAEAMAAIKTLKDEREAALTQPVAKPVFMAHIYTSGIMAGKPVKMLRGIAEAAWVDYCGVIQGAPPATVEEMYGGGKHNKDVAAPSIPIAAADAPGLAPIAVTASVS